MKTRTTSYKFLTLILLALSLNTSPVVSAQENTRKSAQDHVRLPENSQAISDIESKVAGSPDKLDAALRRAGMSAQLMNFNLATRQDLSALGLGEVLFIPIQITTQPGGRKSTYFLAPGEETLTGIYVNGDGLALEYVKRTSGRRIPAVAADRYATRVTNLDGKVIYSGNGVLEKFDARVGTGSIRYEIKSGVGSATRIIIVITESRIWSMRKKTTIIFI